ncbi:uncharacterized protein M6B38_275115 [Iris pallida]|uniref:Uncharacterized protein n=1 Tax=Iris pallida TaxID=29817 RepID=A0AAX6I5K4_IRIPA|nr:uncharacterized protein M6B38_275115 [Iris pallida]
MVAVSFAPAPKVPKFPSSTSPISPRKVHVFPNSPNPRILRPKEERAFVSMPPLSSSSSTALGMSNSAELKAAFPSVVGSNDLLIVGPGVLGRIVAEKWRQDHPDCQIYGQTMTSDHHDELIEVGINPCLRGTKTDNQFPYVIFCAPPSRTADYPGDIRLAASNWSGEGSFLFTSSTSVYDCSNNGLCNEDSPLVPIGRNPRIDVLLKAENAVLEVGGTILRLAGLYISFKYASPKLEHTEVPMSIG